MARRKSRRRRKTTIPVALIAGASAGAIEPVSLIVSGQVTPMRGIEYIIAHYTGYRTWDRRFDLNELKLGLMPLIAGALIHKFVGGTLGVNKALGQAGVPLLRI